MQVKENTNIVQSNFLLENRPKFTKDETRLFLTIVGAINKDDEDFKQLEIPVTEFAELWGMETKTAYNRIKAALRGLVQKEFFIEGINQKTGKTRFLSMSYVSMATYEQGEGYATVEVSQMFKPYLLALKKNYTKYVLENILSLSTVNAIRNYELLKQYESLGTRTFTIDEYKKLLGIENKYSRNTDLRVNVVEPAKEEINQNTDIFIDYEFVGRGKKARITFTILPNAKKKALPGSASESEASDLPSVYDEATDFEAYLLDELPEEVHNGELERVKAINDIARRYISTNFLDYLCLDDEEDERSNLEKISEATRLANEDCNDRILEAVRTFTIREYNVRKSGIKTSPFAYFKAAFEGWLQNRK